MKPVEVIYGQGLLLEGWHSELPAITGLEVRAVSEPEELEAFRRTILKGYGIPESMADIFSKAFVDSANQDPDTLQH